MRKTSRTALATDRVRFVGEPIACVIAETAIAAREAAEAVEVDIDPLPAIVDMRKADAADAPQLHDGIPRNVALDYHYGDAEKTKAAFAKAAHVTKLRLRP